ncbi:reverse transcriptase/maturase family protein [Nocardia vinacea]|uniref:reverse transcriptase/maturase family protein n=1 Tax=Nocardia vinacea TaxID=96468 RepID=UPI001C3F19EE|nr:reverse transcriptase/maturase family protein [Nocardia vinacea]
MSPILCNIYLHKLDEFVERTLIPEYTRGTRRMRNAEYERIRHRLARARKRGDRDRVRQLRTQQARLPSVDCRDPGYRRLRYIRYADDVLLGFAGPKHEAEEIKQRLTRFMREELRLDLSQEKTLITHARTRAARFLGYEITTQTGTGGRKTAEGGIRLRVPIPVIKSSCATYLRGGKPAAQRALQNLHDHDIVAAFGTRYRGIVNYYLLAADVYRLERVRWTMQTSMLKTLAGKHKSSVAKMAVRYRATAETLDGPRTCFEAARHRGNRKPQVARFGGIPLSRRKTAILHDRVPGRNPLPRKEIITRLQRSICELCGTRGEVHIHHVAKLSELAKSGPHQPEWVKIMATRRRKTLVVCPPCHDLIHTGPVQATPLTT